MNSCRVMGYIVICGAESAGEFFSDASAAMRYAEFMSELGYDALYFNASMEGGTVRREERVPEQFMEACVALGL